MKNTSCGFVLVKKVKDSWKVLCLIVDGKYDFPKGHYEKSRDEDFFSAAQRECFEECGIKINLENCSWGNDFCVSDNLIMFLAETDSEAVIKPNPKTGICEHDFYKWINMDVAEKLVSKKLRVPLIWANAKIEGSFNLSRKEN